MAVITALIDAGANPNAKDSNGATPLHWPRRPERAYMDILKNVT